MHVSAIERIISLNKIEGSRNTLILNPGFGKCGSTTLQSLILPFLPIKNYLYEGRHYKYVTQSGKIFGFKPLVYEESLLNYVNNSSMFAARLRQIFEGQIIRVVCLSNELLPSDPGQVSSLLV